MVDVDKNAGMNDILLTIATLLTSLLSGVLGMGGGMILMGVFGFMLSVQSAMVLHGVAQAFSNGSRIWLHRRHIRLKVLAPYAVGAAIVLGVFVKLSFVPHKGVMFLLVGIFPLIALVLPDSLQLHIEKRPVAFACGLIVTLIQMLAGASGPVLNMFYLNSDLTRHEVLASKAVTQTLGHVVKLVYYAFFISLPVDLPLYIYPVVIAAAIAGNWLGKHIVERLHDEQFRRYGRGVMAAIAAVYVVKGIFELSKQ